MLREAGEQRRSVTCDPGMDNELVLIDQPQLGQRQRELHAAQADSFARFPFEPLYGLPQFSAYQLSVPINQFQDSGHDVLLCRMDRPGKRHHPVGHPARPFSRLRDRPPCFLHHLVGHPTEEKGIGLLDVPGVVTVQFFVRDDPGPVIDTPVQGDIDRIPKRSHILILLARFLLSLAIHVG